MNAHAEPAAARPPSYGDVAVRPLRREDVPQVVDLVSAQEFAQGQPREAFFRIFDYPWTPDRPHSGFVLTAGGKIVGAAGTIFSTRTIDGREHRFVNTSTFFVAPEYRRYSLLVMKAVLGLQDHALVTLTASPEMSQLLEKIGFEVVSRRRLFFGPLSRPLAGLLRGGQILDAEREIAGALLPEHLRIHRDHQGLGCGHYVVKDGDRYCYLVTKRRREKGWFLPRFLPSRLRRRRWPVSDVLFVSDPEIAMRHWLPLRWRVARREGTVGVAVEESFLGAFAPKATFTPHHVHVYRRRTDPRSIDALYSELVLLAE